MEGTKRRRVLGARRGRCGLHRCAATTLVIAGLLLVLAGTALAYSEWQAQAKVPQGFGPELTTQAVRAEAKPAGEDEPELLAEGAVILAPMDIAPNPILPDQHHALVLPLLRRESANPGTTDGGARRSKTTLIPRVPSWVDSTYSQVPDGGDPLGTARREAVPVSPTAQPPAGEQSPVEAYPSPIPTTAAPTATPSLLPTPYPPAQSAPSRIQIPALDLDADVVPVGWREVEYHGQRVRVWNVADYAAGWHEASALPGRPGNVVISGHNNIRGEVFRDVANLEAGAGITLTADERPYTYVVESKMIIPERGRPIEERLENNRWIGYFEDERLTLVTCWPYTSNTHRVIVIARPRR
jgi:sortase A